jgi:hypothetical protein
MRKTIFPHFWYKIGEGIEINGVDNWTWTLEKSGIFSVKSLFSLHERKLLQKNLLTVTMRRGMK